MMLDILRRFFFRSWLQIVFLMLLASIFLTLDATGLLVPIGIPAFGYRVLLSAGVSIGIVLIAVIVSRMMPPDFPNEYAGTQQAGDPWYNNSETDISDKKEWNDINKIKK